MDGRVWLMKKAGGRIQADGRIRLLKKGDGRIRLLKGQMNTSKSVS